MEMPPQSEAESLTGAETTLAETERQFVRLTAAELGFAGNEMVEYGPYIATVDQTLLECDPLHHLGPDIARMAIAQGIELYKSNHPETEEEPPEEDTGEGSQLAKKKLN